MSKYLFGPVKSRRLGWSLGVCVIPHKACTYNCIYCQQGETLNPIITRKEYFPSKEIHNQVANFLRDSSRAAEINVITLADPGEPTLASNMGEVIRWIKDMTPIPVAVITNSSLMWMDEVRDELLHADIVLPSVDAISEDVFQRINCPHPSLSNEKILDGIYRFSRLFAGKLFPEVMILEGINDCDREIKLIIEFIKKIRPDRVHLNVAERHVNFDYVRSPSLSRLEDIQSRFPAEIPVDIVGKAPHVFSFGKWNNVEEKILSHLSRRPAVPGDLVSALGIPLELLMPALRKLEKKGGIIEIPDRTDNYFYLNREKNNESV